MTHEPDIIREAEGEWNHPPKYWDVSEEWLCGPDVPSHQRIYRIRATYRITRFTYDGTQDDHGDQHQERA